MAALVDTNVLVYSFDPRFPGKQRRADEILREGVSTRNVKVPHQALLEFVSVVTRRLPGGGSLLAPADAHREMEEMLVEFDVLYPDAHVLRAAARGASTYGLSWFDAHLWAYAECNGLEEILSEDFQHERYYGTVRCLDPFHDLD